jgi:hypothetical protein
MKKVTMSSLVISLGVLALCLVLPLSANAVDKLIVQDAAANTVFVVTDTGNVGVKTAVPLSSLNLVETTADPARGLISSQHNTGPQAGVIVLRKSRGTEAAPAAVASGDFIATIHAQGHDGTQYLSNASTGSMSFLVDGSVAAGSIPTALSFMTGTTPANKAERIRVSSSGFVTINGLAGTYVNGTAYVCINNTGQIFASETPCP